MLVAPELCEGGTSLKSNPRFVHPQTCRDGARARRVTPVFAGRAFAPKNPRQSADKSFFVGDEVTSLKSDISSPQTLAFPFNSCNCVMCRMDSCFTDQSSAFFPRRAATKTRLPTSHAHSGCGTSCAVPSDKCSRNG